MSQYFGLGSLVVVLFGVACSGSTDSGNGSGGGTSQGGTSQAGNTGTAGKATGGSVSAGGSVGAPTVDPRCPATKPMGTCDAEDEGLSCQYEDFNGCLCYSGPAQFGYCQQVNVNCPNFGGAAGTGGAGGSGGAADAGGTAGSGGAADAGGTAGAGGVGGFSAKIAAPPPRDFCTCSAGTWTCSLTF